MKTTFERWIELNNRLNKCFEGLAADRFKKMSASEQN